jgi:hypothetical protein
MVETPPQQKHEPIPPLESDDRLGQSWKSIVKKAIAHTSGISGYDRRMTRQETQTHYQQWSKQLLNTNLCQFHRSKVAIA